MEDRQQRCSRRKFLASAAALTLAGGVSSAESPEGSLPLSRTRPAKPSNKGRKPLAIISTVYRPLSHAYHIGGRFIYGYARGGQLHVPKHYVHSIYVDQSPDNDLSRVVGKEFGIRVTRFGGDRGRAVEEALTDNGNLAVEGVMLIAEHGNYPRNDKGQILYPRLELMEEIVNVFRKTGRSVPVFNDKHLSYTFDRAQKNALLGARAEVSDDGRLQPARHLAQPGSRAAFGVADRGRSRRRLRPHRGVRLPRPGVVAGDDGAAQVRRERRAGRHLPDR